MVRRTTCCFKSVFQRKMMKKILICFWFIYGSILVVNSEYQTTETYEVCPLNPTLNVRLTDVCHFYLHESGNCSNIYRAFAESPTSNVLLLHKQELNITDRFINLFSLCGISVVSLDLTKNYTSKMKFICSSKYQTLAFSVTNFSVEFDQNDINQNRCVKKLTLSSTMQTFLLYCTNLIFVDYSKGCSDKGAKSNNFYTISRSDTSRAVYHKTLKVVTNSLSRLPYVDTIIDSRTNKTIYKGMVFEILEKIARELNFNFTVQEPTDQAWGLYANGSWNGMIGMLHRKEVDMAVAPLTITYPRSTVADFCTPFLFEQIGILIKIQAHNYVEPWKFILLFDFQSWIFIFLSGLASTLCVYFVNVLTPVASARGVENMRSCMWYVYSVMVNQFAVICLNAWSCRMFVIIWRICALILISIYISGLVAILSTHTISLPFKNLREMSQAVKKGEYKICIEANTAFHAAIMEDDTETMTPLRNFLLTNPKYVSGQCLEIFNTEHDLAYVGEITYLKWLQNEFCVNSTMVLLDERFYPGYLAFALQKNSPFNTLVSDKIRETIESGLVDLWSKIYSSKAKFCQIIRPNDAIMALNKPLTIFDLLGLFYLVVIGSAISFGVLVVERYFKHMSQKLMTDLKFIHADKPSTQSFTF